MLLNGLHRNMFKPFRPYRRLLGWYFVRVREDQHSWHRGLIQRDTSMRALWWSKTFALIACAKNLNASSLSLSNVCMGNHFFFVQQCHRNSWEHTFGIDWARMGWHFRQKVECCFGCTVLEERTHWVLQQTRWGLRFGTQIVDREELTELSPRNSVFEKKTVLSETVFDRCLELVWALLSWESVFAS